MPPPMGVDLQGDLRATEEAWLFPLQENPLIHLVELNPAIQVALLFKQKVSFDYHLKGEICAGLYDF